MMSGLGGESGEKEGEEEAQHQAIGVKGHLPLLAYVAQHYPWPGGER